ncbi:HAMP domain-containing sensor histidine kinase [Clostridium tertium]|jgi:signal transduction histidine kinase|nr:MULTISPECIES: HAMP domain-containing sensor histidine kinase [Clostridium]MBS5306213.1 HAMP domain-containing histidine kinase [Clostridium sp.]MDB1922281.1 HAMP domain-containing sensor histidine kinase [Clostridium tertium]MDB1926889.1 HAMP domain-containing sensor histidine kinase [Clostridium tertium]MDB1929868.1 HAMP domain-containing sensor histidine kinase [Clostridium tertium]MDB1933470.1 HAMP domain-containing sensor histidine kinase [Clostridium tertium]
MLSEKNYRRKGLMFNVFIPILVMLIIINIVFKMVNEYIFITRLLCFSISILIFIISIVKVNNKDLGLLKYIGVGYFYIAILRFIDLEYLWREEILGFPMSFIGIITYLELINIISSIVLYKKRYSPKIQNLVFIIVIPIIYIFPLRAYNGLVYLREIYNPNNQFIINQIILLILFGFILYQYKKLDEGNKWIIYTSVLLIVSDSLITLMGILDVNLNSFIWIIKLLSYFLVYEKFEEALLSNAYSSAYESLNKVRKIETNLHKNLKRREKELKELNLLLEKSEKRYYDVVNAFSDGLLLFENDIMVHSNYYNDIYYNMPSKIVCTQSELRLNCILNKIIGIEYPDDYEINNFSAEVSIQDEYGEIKELEVSLVKIYDDKKILLFNDVTKLVKQRDEILKLEKKINDENIKDEFYSNISHELRTPINVIYSALQLNDMYLKNCEVTKINRNNNIIRQNCLRLIRTINNFIDSNKLSEGFLEINKRVYNIVDIIENVVLSCNFYMNLRETKLTFDPEYEEIYFYCDKDYIERIMLNILSNSLKYGKFKGNIYVMLRIENKKNIIIEVINDAEAIPEDKRKVIFDKFTKVNTSLNRPSEGSGLGLFLTKGLVELHNGKITINAGIKYGNIFKITFPYDNNIKGEVVLLNNNVEINELQEKIDIEFSDIYF